MLQSKEENNAECGWLNGHKVSESIFAVKDMAFNTKWLRKTYLLVLFLEFLNEIRDTEAINICYVTKVPYKNKKKENRSVHRIKGDYLFGLPNDTVFAFQTMC